MNKDRIALGIRAIRELEKQRNRLCNDIDISIVKIQTYDKEITEITEILNTELLKTVETAREANNANIYI